MLDLKKIWTCEGLLVDKNGDGVPDGVRVNVAGVNTECMPLGIINFYARLGLETTALSLPITNYTNSDSWLVQLSIEGILGNRAIVEARSSQMLLIQGGNVQILSGLLSWLATSWPYEVPEDWEGKQIVRLEWMKDRYRADFFDSEQSNWVGILPKEAPSPPISSLGGLQKLWTVQGFYQGGRIDLNSKLNVGFTFKNGISPEVLLSTADLAARIGLSSTGIQFPLTEKSQSELEFVIRLNDSDRAEVCWEDNKVYFTGGTDSVVTAIHYFANAKRYEEGGTFALWEHAIKTSEIEEVPILYQKEWYDQGEKEDLLNMLKDKTADQVVVYLSEPADIRKELENVIGDTNGAEDVRVRSAFKPGYFWIEEEIMPLLKAGTIGKIHIVCQKNSRGLEMSNRWIQELYPIDEVLSRYLLMETDTIEFSLEEMDANYEFIAYDADGKCVFKQSLKVPTIEMDYINGKDKVYPTTGAVQLYRGGKLVFEHHNPTDRERFWLFFKNEVLPEIIELLPLEEKGRGDEVPFFSRLLVEVSMSEEERKLGIEEERISSLEALHEDIYFNVLDFFEYLGEQRTGNRWNAPGGVYPFMHVEKGVQPSARIKLYGFTHREKIEVITQKMTFERGLNDPVSCEIQLPSGELRQILFDEWKSVSLPDIREDIRQLGELSGVHLWLGGISYEGRSIPVLDVFKPNDEEFFSSHKLSLFKPTILIETGHHANEVSSSPAVKEMIREIIEKRQDLLNDVNLVIIPCANPDGSHLHRLLTSENPEWKHHAARYNAVGLEYSHVRYKNTIFGEADVVPNAIHRWLPDIIIDGHGIPGHEWIQPFAGFNSPPRFPVSYSIPISFIYGITKDLDLKEFPEHREIQDFLISGITKRINQIEYIQTKNEYWRNRYRKYGTNWEPDSFPIEEQDGMNFYHWDTKVNPESTQYISRYPEWCSADFITEAADETVYGDTLAGCILSQKAFFLGVIEQTAVCTANVKVSSLHRLIQYERKRPLQKR